MGARAGRPVTGPVTVVTIVRGRLGHLQRQAWGLARQRETGFRWVVVRMGGPDVREAAHQDGLDPAVVDLPVGDGEPLPLAAARNAGIAAAQRDDGPGDDAQGDDGQGGTVVLLDVDVVPSPDLVGTYVDAVARTGGVVAGPVGYLPPGCPPRGRTSPGWARTPSRTPRGRCRRPASSSPRTAGSCCGPCRWRRPPRCCSGWGVRRALRRLRR